VLGEVDAARVDEVWCLGDLVGYGPRPNECVALLRDRGALCLAGNHDLVVLGKIPMLAFGGDAARAALWTQRVLDEEARAFLEPLEPQGSSRGVALFHASARDPVWEYVLSVAAARATLERVEAPLVLVGHSHAALEFSESGGEVRGDAVPAGTTLQLGESRRLLNPGSVGQPRDGDPRAAWLEIDNTGGWATFRRTSYPVERTQTEMREAGLPEALAARLAHGL
jgi:diadenosine tetraphosphatase ApaH/serine/threonine PP2A family protein phosphatase